MIKSKLPKMISGILAAILIAIVSYLLLPPVWFWIGFEVVAALLVAVGCVGEWYLFHHPAGREKREKEQHRKFEARFILAVAAGVTMEFFALAHAIPEAIRLELQVAQLNKETETLRIENHKLELIIKPRALTDEQAEVGIELLKKYAGTKADVTAMMDNWESIGFARRLNVILVAAKWDVGNDVGFVMEQGRGAEDGVFISTNEFSNIAAARALNDFLNGCGIESRLLPAIYGRFRSSKRTLYIRVGTKPPPKMPAVQ